VRPLVLCLMAIGAVVMPADAKAFCRTTTSQVPSGYDPAVSGCWPQGTPLAWPMSQVPYGVASAASRQVSLADATRIAHLAFGAWKNANCSGHAPNIEALDDGPIAAVPEAGDCTISGRCDPAAHDVIVFDDDKWPYNDSANSLALTTVTYGVDDGRIFEAHTEVNSAEHQLTTQEPPPANSSAYDLQAILTHEAGHFLGLAHATETTSIMYAFYQPGGIALTADDINGICTIHPPSKPSSGGCSSTSAPTPSGSSAIGGALVVLFACRRRRRQHDEGKVSVVLGRPGATCSLRRRAPAALCSSSVSRCNSSRRGPFRRRRILSQSR
jgi:MYXO-CTERM domain-containing protein